MPHSNAVIDELDALLRESGPDGPIVGYAAEAVEPPEGGEEGIRVYVAEAAPPDLPAEIRGLKVHTVAIGRPQNKSAAGPAVNPETKVRPVIGGLGISKPDAYGGTLGYFVNRDGKLSVLSAAHVVEKDKKTIVQPDRAKAADKIAEIVDWQMLPDNGVDALAAPLVDTEATLTLNDIGKVTGTAQAVKDSAVRKSGKKTGVTTGKVESTNATMNAPEGIFKDMILIAAEGGPFSQGGDSGSLVVDKDLKAIGILKGGSDTHDFLCKIDNVLNALNATFAT